jgi:hypothetical protein
VRWALRARTPAEAAAAAWLVMRFVDPEAEVLHAHEEGASGFAGRKGRAPSTRPRAAFSPSRR